MPSVVSRLHPKLSGAEVQEIPPRRPLYMTESLVEVGESPNMLGRLKKEDYEAVVSRGQRRTYETGEFVFRQGLQHDGIFIILTGQVRSFYIGYNGREITLAYWTPGHFVGGPEIFGGGEHMWTAEATERSDILQLSGASLRSLVQAVPSFAIGLIDALVHKGKCYSALLQLLGTRSATKRLAHLILTMAERAGTQDGDRVVIELHFADEEMANMVGATRQWVSMTLSRFENEGLIASEGQRMVVLNPKGLLNESL